MASGIPIRFWLDHEQRVRDRAMFDLAVDSKLRGCDIVEIRIGDLVSGGRVRSRAIVVQRKTGRPVQFELLEPARASILAWLERRGGTLDDFAFPSRVDHTAHMSTRQYARLVDEWVMGIGLRREDYGTHSLRRTKASITTSRPATRGPYRFCSDIRRLRAPCGTSWLISRMRSPSPKPPRSNGRAPRVHIGESGPNSEGQTDCAHPGRNRGRLGFPKRK